MIRSYYITGIIVFLTCMLASSAYAMPGNIRWNDEQRDTTFITDLLISIDPSRPLSDNIVTLGRAFEGRPYGNGTLEKNPEMLTVNTDTLDCTTFVEYIAALAKTIQEGRTSWRDFVYNLQSLRYRNGSVSDYASRLHYISEWIVDNAHRGNFTEVTTRVSPDARYAVKSLDYMSANREKYPALADQKVFDRIKSYELGYRSHRFPYIKPLDIDRCELRNGDIIAITTKTPGLDVSHMGIVVLDEKNRPHLLHASSKHGSVMLDPLTLSDYLRRSKSVTGIRVIRID